MIPDKLLKVGKRLTNLEDGIATGKLGDVAIGVLMAKAFDLRQEITTEMQRLHGISDNYRKLN